MIHAWQSTVGVLHICGKQLLEMITKRCPLNITVLGLFTIFLLNLLTELVFKSLIQKQHDCNRMGHILFFLYIVQVLDMTSGKENANILIPDQSSG